MKIENNLKRISVLIAGPYDKTYDYYVDKQLYQIGKIVIVPFKSQKNLGIIIGDGTEDIDIKKLKLVEIVFNIHPLTKSQIEFMNFFSRWNCVRKGIILKQFLSPHDKNSLKKLDEKQNIENVKNSANKKHFLLELNNDQIIAANSIIKALDNKSPDVFLLEGVAGSGKTETYFEAINHCIKNKKQVLILLPEIGLTSEWDRRFRDRFGIIAHKWHSGVKKSVKKKIWIKAVQKKNIIVVGARSALFLPLNNLGLIVIDEEHDTSFKQEESFRYHARDMAIYLGSKKNIPVILCSATPSFETLYNTSVNKYIHLNLSSRATGAKMPLINIIDLKDNPPESGFWISEPMIDELKFRYKNKEQSMLFLNRRGYSNFTICKSCGYKVSCNNCNSWLVEHKNIKKFLCHHCGLKKNISGICVQCNQKTLVPCGPGIEKINEEVKNLFPNASIENLSSDTIKNVNHFNDVINKILSGKVDFIIGTQLLAKGYDFSFLNYVGIIDGDVGLYGSDFRASEKYFQLLTQVSGRAGRHLTRKQGLVQIQTYNPKNPILKTIKEMDKKNFFKEEISYRELSSSPPFSRLISIIVSSKKNMS